MSGFNKRKLDAVGKSPNGFTLTWDDNDDDDIIVVPKKKVKKEKKTKKISGKSAMPVKTKKGGQKQRTRRRIR